jgi:hypothetical protein
MRVRFSQWIGGAGVAGYWYAVGGTILRPIRVYGATEEQCRQAYADALEEQRRGTGEA